MRDKMLPGPKTIELRILSGSYSHAALMALKPKRLETVLSFMVEFSCRRQQSDLGAAQAKAPRWWPDSGASLESVRTCAPRERARLLRSIVTEGHAFYKRAPAIRPRKRRNGKIVIPNLLKLRKPRPKMSNSDHVLGRIKRLNCVVKLQKIRDYTLAKNILSPVVRLRDVLKPPRPKPIIKADFMSSLSLATSSNPSKADPQRTVDMKYSCNIPFTSDMGQLLVNKDKYTMSKEMLTRKTEKLDYYLENHGTTPKDLPYEVTYSRRHPCDHRYHYPSRQFRKRRRNLDTVLAFCKPLTVRLQRLDVRRHENRNVVIKDLRVVLTKID